MLTRIEGILRISWGRGASLLGYRPELERSRSGECALSGADRVWTRRTPTLYAYYRNVGKIRHKGLLFSIGLVEDKESRVPATNEKVAKVTSSCKGEDLSFGRRAARWLASTTLSPSPLS